MPELHFIWDEKKNKRNQRLHGISFEDAKHVFNDPNKIIIPDIAHGEETEERWNLLGLADKLQFVVYTEERDTVIRIISARIATMAEQEAYNVGNIGT
jgi:uncharacterized DUF497 family protein